MTEDMNSKLQTTQRRMMRMIIQTSENIRKKSRRERRRNRGRRTFTTPPAHPWTTRQSTSTKTSTSTKEAVAAATFASTKTQETVQKTNWSRGPTTKREQRTKRATCQQQPESRLWTFRQSQIYSRHARMIALHQAKKVPQKKEDWTRDGKTTCQTSIYNLIKPRETNNDLATFTTAENSLNVMLWKVTSKEADSNNQHDPTTFTKTTTTTQPRESRRRSPNRARSTRGRQGCWTKLVSNWNTAKSTKHNRLLEVWCALWARWSLYFGVVMGFISRTSWTEQRCCGVGVRSDSGSIRADVSSLERRGIRHTHCVEIENDLFSPCWTHVTQNDE